MIIHDEVAFFKNKGKKIPVIATPAIFIIFQTYNFEIFFAVQIVLMVMGTIGLFLTFHLVLIKKTMFITMLFIMNFSGFLSTIFYFLDTIGIYGTVELGYALYYIFIVTMMVCGLVAYLEYRIIASHDQVIESYNRVSFYKSVFTHDIGNIMNSINAAAKLFEMVPNGEGISNQKLYDKIYDVLINQTTKALKLISDIRHLTNLEEKKIDFKNIKLDKIVDDGVRFIKKCFPTKQIIVNINENKQNISIKANVLLRSAIENVLHNAVKHNKNNSIEINISIDAIHKGDKLYYRISIMDNGLGIPEKIKNKLFITSIEKTKGERGLGLGLMIVRKVMDLYEGFIEVEDRLEEGRKLGSIFRLHIPVEWINI
jgi:signal transduction histidine kinase